MMFVSSGGLAFSGCKEKAGTTRGKRHDVIVLQRSRPGGASYLKALKPGLGEMKTIVPQQLKALGS